MRSSRIVFALSFVLGAFGYLVTSPSATSPWTSTGPNSLSWNRVDTDPSTFAVVLTNTASVHQAFQTHADELINPIPSIKTGPHCLARQQSAPRRVHRRDNWRGRHFTRARRLLPSWGGLQGQLDQVLGRIGFHPRTISYVHDPRHGQP